MSQANPQAWGDNVRALVILFAQNIITAAVLIFGLAWDGEQVASAMGVINTAVTLTFLLLPKKPPTIDLVTLREAFQALSIEEKAAITGG